MSLPSPGDRSSARDSTEFRDSTSPAAQEAEALDAVVRATLESADERVTPEEIEALTAVARRLGDLPLAFDPIAVELVEAIINVNYGQLRRPPEVWRSTAVKIATLLFESPAAHARLENLWRRLVEAK